MHNKSLECGCSFSAKGKPAKKLSQLPWGKEQNDLFIIIPRLLHKEREICYTIIT